MWAIFCPSAAWNNTHTHILIDRAELSPRSALCPVVACMWKEAIECSRSLPPFTPPIQSSRWYALYSFCMCEFASTAPFLYCPELSNILLLPSFSTFHLPPVSILFFRSTFDPVVRGVLGGLVIVGRCGWTSVKRSIHFHYRSDFNTTHINSVKFLGELTTFHVVRFNVI